MLSNKMVLVQSLMMATTLLVVSCGPSSASKQVVPEDVSKYAEASCKYRFDEGPTALAKSSANIKTSYYGKKIDMALLAPVLGASSSELVHFAESTEVKFYRTSASEDVGCDFAQSLPVAPSDLDEDFKKSGASTLGLYLNSDAPDMPSTKGKGAIIVRENTNKWVLVHEYLHHLFQIESETTGSETKAKFMKARTAFSLYVYISARKENAKDALKALVDYNILTAQMLKTFFLEETTIEAILAEKLKKGELQYVLAEQAINGAGYTLLSSKKSEGYIAEIEKRNQEFKNSYGKYLESNELKKLDNAAKEFAVIQTEMKNLRSKAKAFLAEKNIDLYGVTAGFTAEEHPVVGCSHGAGVDELMAPIEPLTE